jgi:Domain of unknown function (DUF3560)
MAITVRHSHADGTLVEGDTRPYKDLLGRQGLGLRWSRTLGCWYVPHSRDKHADQPRIDRIVATLTGAGVAVDVEVDNTPRGAAEREHDRHARLEGRRDRLQDRAGRLAGQAQAAYQRSHQITGQIPMGQPILVGHHSERRHRRDLERADRAMRQSVELADGAETAADRAGGSRAAEAHRMSGPATMRRIDTFEAERRRILRALEGRVEAAVEASEGGFAVTGFHRELPTERHAERHAERPAALLRARLASVDDDLVFWRQHLQGLKDRGEFTQYGPGDFAKGDRVQVDGWKGTVLRVNRKSLTVHRDGLPAVFDGPVDYSKVRPLVTPEEA